MSFRPRHEDFEVERKKSTESEEPEGSEESAESAESAELFLLI